MNEPTVNIDKFLGIRNKEQSRRLKVGSLDVAENVDIDDMGGVVLREGFVSSLALTAVTASFSTHDERRAFVIANGELLLINTDLTTVTLLSGLSDEYVYWLEVADFILMSTGHVINKDNQVSLWRIPNPVQPGIEVVGGNLSAGQYQVTCTYIDDLARESGASDVVTIELDDNSGLAITPTYDGYKVRVYISDVNGTEMYLYGEYSAGGLIVTSMEGYVYPIDDVQLKSYPAPNDTKHLAFYDGRVYTSQLSSGTSVIWFSEPFWWNLFDLSESYLSIPGKVTALIGTLQGLIIGTDDEIYAYADNSLVRLAEYGMPEGCSYSVDDNGKVYLWTNQGLCEALPFQNLTENKVSLPAGDTCHVSVVDQNGFSKVVVLTDGNGTADNKL